EVEGITNPAETLKGFVVGYVVEAKQHPNADRLRVCTVDTGSGTVQVVCGAPNARTGMKGIFAPTGSYIPGTDLHLKASKIRGEDSNGMLCSSRELKNGPSPDWLQRRLKAIGLRPISALVDITNLVTFDLNRPLHVFDARKLSGDLVMRQARDGEAILALDGKTYMLDPSVAVIA